MQDETIIAALRIAAKREAQRLMPAIRAKFKEHGLLDDLDADEVEQLIYEKLWMRMHKWIVPTEPPL